MFRTLVSASAVAGVLLLAPAGTADAQSASMTPTPSSESPTPSATPHSDFPSPSATSPSPQATPCESPFFWSFSITHRTITAGNAPKLYGESYSYGGSYPDCSPASSPVRIYERRYGEQGLREVATVQPDAKGRYEIAVRPLVQTDYLAAIGDSPGFSGKVTVKVHRRIVIDGTLVDEGGYSNGVHGHLVPPDAGVPVGLNRQGADGQLTYLNQAVSDSSGRFRLGYNRTGEWRGYFVYTSAWHGSLRGSTYFAAGNPVQ